MVVKLSFFSSIELYVLIFYIKKRKYDFEGSDFVVNVVVDEIQKRKKGKNRGK